MNLSEKVIGKYLLLEAKRTHKAQRIANKLSKKIREHSNFAKNSVEHLNFQDAQKSMKSMMRYLKVYKSLLEAEYYQLLKN